MTRSSDSRRNGVNDTYIGPNEDDRIVGLGIYAIIPTFRLDTLTAPMGSALSLTLNVTSLVHNVVDRECSRW